MADRTSLGGGHLLSLTTSATSENGNFQNIHTSMIILEIPMFTCCNF